jgi:hypothetical protein
MLAGCQQYETKPVRCRGWALCFHGHTEAKMAMYVANDKQCVGGFGEFQKLDAIRQLRKVFACYRFSQNWQI